MLSRLRSIRQRLLVLVLVPLFLMTCVLLALFYVWTSEVGYRHLLMKASTDLAVTRESFKNTQESYLTRLALRAQTQRFQDAWRARDKAALMQSVSDIRDQVGLDYVQLLTPQGCGYFSGACGGTDSPLFVSAAAGQPVSGIEIFTQQRLHSLSPELAERAVLPLTATEKAQPVNRKTEDRGMVVHLVYPLPDEEGHTEALLSAGLLMNGNTGFVDRIKDTVYGGSSLVFGSVGTVTIFLDDVRISTNVPASQDSAVRALGTRVSDQVRKKVLEQGEHWLDRAFVVSDWYISGYQPIMDIRGERVGMLYAGFLEAPFEQELYSWVWQLIAITGVIMLVCTWLAVWGAKGIYRPVETMVGVIGRIRQGRRERIDLPATTSSDLMTLGAEFNLMLDQVEQQHDHIQQAAEQLEMKVAERTLALNEHIKLLQRTREQLVAKGKLAAIGELTAGIAHEINNPTAVILGYLDLLVVELGEAGDQVKDEVQLIIQQVERIRSIINDLLQFSRPGDHSPALVPLELNEIVQATELLVKHDLGQKQISLNMDLRASNRVAANRQQLQQVLINLIVNATAAVGQNGRITVRSRDWRNTGVLLSISDNGCGIAADMLGRIFDPFFSRTSGGTGLGLSVTYSILQSMNAEINVRSREGHGTTFFIWIPAYQG